MELKTQYITPDDFKAYFGIDLDAQIKDDDNASNKGDAFLLRIENRLATFIDANFYRNVALEYPVFTDYQKEHYKLALLEQAIYVFKNGDISVDSGYDAERGVIADRGKITLLSIAPNAKQELMLCGLWTRKIRGGKRNLLNRWIN